MQEVTSSSSSASSGLTSSFDQLRTSALVDASSSTRAFSDFMTLAGRQGYGGSTASSGLSRYLEDAQSSAGAGQVSNSESTAQALRTSGVAPVVGSDAQNLFAATASDKINMAQNAAAGQSAAQTANQQTAQAQQTGSAASSQASSSGTKTDKKTSETGSSTGANAQSAVAQALANAKNTKVSRQSFEEARPLLIKSGFSEKEIDDLSARVQTGALTWGQMVQAMAAHSAGAQKSVQLTDTEKTSLQSMFQKLGFDSQSSQDLVGSMANGEGLKVLSAIQSKLQNMPDGTSVNLNQDELSTFFKALRAPSATAQALTQKLGSGGATAGDVKTALGVLGQSLTAQRAEQAAQDTDTAKSMAKIMQKDVAKNARDTSGTTTASGSADPQVAYDLKTKDKNDTSWFGDHEKNQQQQANSDDAWKSFVSKVRQDDSGAQSAFSSASGSSSQSSATLAAANASAKSGTNTSTLGGTAAGMSGLTQQSGTGASQQAKAFDKVLAPKVLDQVSEAMLKDLGQGRKQLTMELDPENLGKVQVLLQVKGKEVSAVIHAEDSGTAAMLHANMEGLRKSLEDKGLTVQHMEVQTGLASRQDQQQATFNADQHNQQAQEQQQSMSRVLTQLRMVRSEGDVALDMQNKTVQAILADQGLHLIA